MSKPSRGRLYIDKDVQRALVLQLVRHWAVFVVVLTGMLLALEALGQPGASLGEHVASLWTRHAALLAVIASLFPVFMYDSMKLSNRFAGPIMRLRRALREANAGGPPQPLKFRKDDFWQDMADSFNELVERLHASERESPSEQPRGKTATCEAAERRDEWSRVTEEKMAGHDEMAEALSR